MDDTWRNSPGRAARAVVLGLGLGVATLSGGCGGRPETGDTIQRAPGQDAGEQASMEEMKRLMEQGKVQ